LRHFVSRKPYIRIVTLADVTAAGVRAAIEEFVRLGKEEFLRSTGFSHAQVFLEHDGQLYDECEASRNA
jgi:hypothetical protein